MSEDSYGIAKCTILQSPDGAPRYRIMYPYADKSQRTAAWDEACAQATPSRYIEFWVTDESTMQIAWNEYWHPGLWYDGKPGDDIRAYLPSALSSCLASDDAQSRFLDEYIVQFDPYYYVDGLGGFGILYFFGFALAAVVLCSALACSGLIGSIGKATPLAQLIATRLLFVLSF